MLLCFVGVSSFISLLMAAFLKSVKVPFICDFCEFWKLGSEQLCLCSGVITLEAMLEHSVGLTVVLSSQSLSAFLSSIMIVGSLVNSLLLCGLFITFSFLIVSCRFSSFSCLFSEWSHSLLICYSMGIFWILANSENFYLLSFLFTDTVLCKKWGGNLIFFFFGAESRSTN